MKYPVTAVFIARNEEMIIGQSLDAVKEWVDEIILIDMKSIDTTVQIGQEKGALIFETELLWNFDIARTIGIKKAKNQWVLIVDADEIISTELAKEITYSIENDIADLLYLPFANFALSGFGPFESAFPDFHPRCFKKDAMMVDDYKGELHSNIQPKDGIRIVKLRAAFPESCVYHITNPTLEYLIGKINKYTTAEARIHYSDTIRLNKIRVVLSGLKVFWKHYIVRKGYRDGWRGFLLSIVFVFYRFLVFGKQWEMSLHKGKYPSVKEARDQMNTFITNALEKNGFLLGTSKYSTK